MAEVSIIVPVYNVASYLAKCLDSCINQNFTDMEIVCVNDGSTDSSVEILQAYSKFDSRIKIINKKNGGLSSARNAGIAEACGKYIMFVDSDDWISSDAVGKLYKNVEDNNSDVVILIMSMEILILKRKSGLQQFLVMLISINLLTLNQCCRLHTNIFRLPHGLNFIEQI